MNTKWEGLWAQERQGFYSGYVISKKDIPKYTRLVVRYNKYYEKDKSKPRFVYCFADSEGYESKCKLLEIEDSLSGKVERLKDVMREGSSCPMMLPSESQVRAGKLMREAIEIIEDMTGEKWNFEYYTF